MVLAFCARAHASVTRAVLQVYPFSIPFPHKMATSVEANPYSGTTEDSQNFILFRGKKFYIDHWIDQVRQCRYLPENEMRILCSL